MECKRCHLEVPANFEYAIAQNTCPKCGSKLMNELAMKMFLHLKKDLHKVQLIMDPEVNYEKIAMFLVNNYSVRPYEGGEDIEEEMVDEDAEEYQEEDMSAKPEDMTDEEYRAQLAEEAEMKMMEGEGEGIDLNHDAVQKRVARLKKVAKKAKELNDKGTFSVRRVPLGE